MQNVATTSRLPVASDPNSITGQGAKKCPPTGAAVQALTPSSSANPLPSGLCSGQYQPTTGTAPVGIAGSIASGNACACGVTDCACGENEAHAAYLASRGQPVGRIPARGEGADAYAEDPAPTWGEWAERNGGAL